MLNSHTHCQVAPADTQAKTWQRMCLFQPPQLTDNQDEKKNTERTVRSPYLFCLVYDLTV